MFEKKYQIQITVFQEEQKVIEYPSMSSMLMNSTNIWWYLSTLSNSIFTLMPRQNGGHLPVDILKYIFLDEMCEFSLKYVPNFPVDNIPTLFQVMFGANQATSHYLNQWWLVYLRIYASLGFHELFARSCSVTVKNIAVLTGYT